MKDSIIERVKELINKRGVTPRGFASEIDFNYSTLNNYLTGRRKAIDCDLIAKIVSSFGNISANWLLNGEGNMFISENLKEKEKMETLPRIPGSVAAGALNGFSDAIKSYDCEQVPVVKAFPKYDYTILVRGDSMEPIFRSGDEIAISKVNDVIEWGKVYVLDTRDGAVLKRLYNSEQRYRCVSYNPEYPDFFVPKNDVFGVYKIVGLLRIGL